MNFSPVIDRLDKQDTDVDHLRRYREPFLGAKAPLGLVHVGRYLGHTKSL